jgi:hypothetical protein
LGRLSGRPKLFNVNHLSGGHVVTFQEFPKWLYIGMDGTLVDNAEEEAALGDGYNAFPLETAEEAVETAAEPKPRGRPRRLN